MQSSTHMHMARALPARLALAVQTTLLLLVAPRGGDAVAATASVSSAALQHFGGEPAPAGRGGQRPHQIAAQANASGAAAPPPPMRVIVEADGVPEPPTGHVASKVSTAPLLTASKLTALDHAPADANASAHFSDAGALWALRRAPADANASSAHLPAAGATATLPHEVHRYSGPCKFAPHLCGQRRMPVLAETQAQAHARSETTLFGFGTIIDIIIIAAIVLVALFFLWGGTWTQLKEDPVGSLQHTVMEAHEKISEAAVDQTITSQFQTRMKNAAPCC